MYAIEKKSGVVRSFSVTALVWPLTYSFIYSLIHYCHCSRVCHSERGPISSFYPSKCEIQELRMGATENNICCIYFKGESYPVIEQWFSKA